MSHAWAGAYRAWPGTASFNDGPAVHALFVYNSNPGAVAPNHNAVVRGLERPDLFTVVHEQFFTDTTDYADYVLPATTFLEHTDIQGAYGHYFVQLSQQAIEPPGESRSNVWLFSQLAQRMGFTEECFRDTPEQMIRQALAIGSDGHSTNASMEHITLEDLEQQGHIPLAFHREPDDASLSALHVGTRAYAFRQNRVLLRDARGAGPRSAAGLCPACESRWSEAAKLSAGIPGPQERQLHELHLRQSRWPSQDGSAHRSEARNPSAGRARRAAFSDGDSVRIFNDRGSLTLTAMVNGSVPAGVVARASTGPSFTPSATM